MVLEIKCQAKFDRVDLATLKLKENGLILNFNVEEKVSELLKKC